MFDKFTDRARKIIALAQKEAERFHHDYIGTEHILLGLVKEGSGVAVTALNNLSVDVEKVRREVEKLVVSHEKDGPSTPLPFTPPAKKVLELANEEARALGHPYIGTEHILLGLLRENDSVAAQVLINLGLRLEDVRAEILDLLGASDPTAAPTASDKHMEKPRSGGKGKADETATPALDAFGRNLTEAAENGELDPVIGRSKEIERLWQILCRRTKNNPVLLGEPGVGKTAIVEGLAQSIINHDVPDILANKQIITLDLASMVAGTKYRGQFEERIKAVMKEVKTQKNIILFIDELHTLVGAGGAEGAIDASNVLKPALSRGEIQVIGATTLNEYRKYIEKDGALERRFQSIIVEPPSIPDAVDILKGLRDRYEAHHRVKITDDAVTAAVTLSDRYISGRFLPDKAIDVIDESGAKLRLQASSKAPAFKQVEQEIKEFERLKSEAVLNQDYEKAAEYRDKTEQKKAELMQLRKASEESAKELCGTVDEDLIREVVGKMTGIAVQRLDQNEAKRLLQLEDFLHQRVISQDEAIRALARAIRRSRAGLKDPKRPTGSFVFVGPTGVGKTLLCKALAEFMFGEEEALIQVDMSEFMEKHNASLLVGAPPGYVGYEDGGQLTEKVRRRPYSVILLDEIEKAHADIFNMLLQIMEEGHLTDNFGRKIDFKNTILIMTSNVGAAQASDAGTLGFDTSGDSSEDYAYKSSKNAYQRAMEDYFKPEFINRLDEVVVFRPLEREDLKQVVGLEFKQLAKRIVDHGIHLELSESGAELLLKKGFNPRFGARPIRRILETHIEDPLSEALLRGEFSTGSRISVDAEDDQIIFRRLESLPPEDAEGSDGDEAPAAEDTADTGESTREESSDLRE
ncbi:MAG: ATP-dependent Clp protease ATP-binding subunit [Planctomycetota bacterium]|nr:MAG: ATP-dependent Clp protease ATP-binding subunit [Planctomycetota bacterium]